MKKKSRTVIVFILFAVMLSIPVIIFFTRAPVLIVAEQAFVLIYGENRLRIETIKSSLTLFRHVKTIRMAQDAGDDIIRFAIQDVSKDPYCVIFPLRYARSAVFYSEHNSGHRILILEGRYSLDNNIRALMQNEQFFIYKTNIQDEFYRAGVAAAFLAGNNSGNIALFIDPAQNSLYGTQARSAFLRGINDFYDLYAGEYRSSPPETSFFLSFSDYQDIQLSCVVMAGAGQEYFEKKTGVPAILFTWMEPAYTPPDTVIIVDDSLWIQTVNAVKMAFDPENEETLLKSRFRVLDRGKFSADVLRKIGVSLFNFIDL